MKNIFTLLIGLLICSGLSAQQKTSSGTLEEYPEFQSSYISPRTVRVWLPDGYSSKNRYDVLYMHDGQMLFDADCTWNGQEWEVDENVGRLIGMGRIRPCIVVGIDNIAESRYGDYFPQKTLDFLPEGTKIPEDISYNADNYLKFLVKELKPFIDSRYSTNRSRQHTFVMGSSMGGLISLYAICEYPEVFGGAGCLSTHVPMVLNNSVSDADMYSRAFRDYLDANLPKADSRIIYMDRGDATLDASYPEYQDAVDSLFISKGWSDPYWTSKVFPGAAHTETDWADRLINPLQYLLGTQKKGSVERIDPPFWWCGMKQDTLQLLVTGQDIAYYTPEISWPGVKIIRTIPMESPNYLAIYADVKDAVPGTFEITFTRNGKTLKHSYELKERETDSASRQGFSSSDVIYLIMPDRFSNGDTSNDNAEVSNTDILDRSVMTARHGGDLAGIRNHLDYFEKMGITALWLTPVVENDMKDNSYHGYAATDYYRIDPRYGSNEEYAGLSKEMKKKGIKLIMDMVFNHCGSEHPWMMDPPARDWFNYSNGFVPTNHDKAAFFDLYASDIDMQEMADGWFVKTMPDLNQRNTVLADYLIQNSIWWIEYAGLGGIRQDTYPYPDKEMMGRWCKAVFNEYPDFNIVGEVMIPTPAGAGFWQSGSRLNPEDTYLKSVMDFHLQAIGPEAFNEETSWDKGLQKIFEHFCYDFCYGDVFNVMRFYENHDTDRFFRTAPENLDSFKQAVTLLLTVPGIPKLFYGQEILVSGDTKIDFANVRPDFPGGWDGDKANAFTGKGLTDMQKEAQEFTARLINWRKGNDVAAKGSMKHFMPRNNIYVYQREYEGKSFVVIMNGISGESVMDMSHYREVFGGLDKATDFLSGKTVSLEGMLRLKGKEVLLLELRN